MVEAAGAKETAAGGVGAAVLAAAADVAEGSGLDKAAAAAGDVLRGIFGGLPWEMTPSEIVNAVANGAAEAAAGVLDAVAGAAGQVLPVVL